jgi:hypothetical protein
MQDFLINNPVLVMIKMAFREECHFEQFPAIRYNLFLSMKRKGFSLLSGLCDDRITCFDKGT